MTRRFEPFAYTLAALLAAGCGAGSSSPADPGGGGGGGGGGGEVTPPPPPATGIALPQEVSALPPRSVAAPSAATAFRGLARALAAPAFAADSDYETARTVKWVNEQALSRFDILNSIFEAIGQTHYADAGNVGAGPYGAMVTAVGGEQEQKSLQLWVVSSRMETENGLPVNVLDAWIEDPEAIVTAVVKIYQAPTQNADGSYSDYGVWTITADLSPDGAAFFVATAEVDPAGGSIVKVHQTEGGPGGPAGLVTRGILHKSGTAGYGKVSYPDWSQCGGPSCSPPITTVAYTYDAHHVMLGIDDGGAPRTAFKDRDVIVDLVERYGLYDASGADVAKVHRFGFPFQVGGASWGYYGAWQGRHQLWANGQPIAAGATVTRADRRPDAPVESFTASPVYAGVLAKRTYVDAQLADIQGLVVNAWDFQSFQLQGDGTSWHRCQAAPDQAPTCETAPFADFASLVGDPATRTEVHVDAWVNGAPVALSLNGAQDGFVVAGSGEAFPPAQYAWVNANVGGPIWITFTGSGWEKLEVISIDESSWQPVFGAGRTAYAVPEGRELYLNDMGVNYVVRCSAGSCAVKLENQTVANPANVSSFVAADTIFTQQAWGQAPSTFRLETDPGSGAFMKLVYVTVGQQDAQRSPAPQPGDVVTQGQWGLTATVGGVEVQFNWEYPDAGNGCGSCGVQQFLLDAQGELVLLDDPIRLAPIELANGAGVTRTYSLTFDGSWVGGLPDLHDDLREAGWELTPEIQAKAVAIPSGTVVADAADPTRQYVFKQLQIAEFLATIADPGGLDLALAQALDLATVPSWVATGLGARPDYVLRYSEGVPVE